MTIERLSQDYARFFHIEPYLWEFEAMVASGHFQDSIEPPSAFDVVILILWSRLGTNLPERTALREYRGLDGRTPVTGTEWEFEEAFNAAKQKGAPDLLVYRNLKSAPFDTYDRARFEQQSQQLIALNTFWERHFANQGMFIGAYTSFTSDAEFAASLENHLRKLVERRIASIASAQTDPAAPKVWTQAPFRGLEAYDFEHAPIFFGQDQVLSRAMLQLTANAEAGSPFLLVLGASGSGKSSLVKAGIVPKLFVPRRIPGTAFLRRVVFRPSDAQDDEDIFDAFARRLTTQLSPQEGLSELLRHGQSVSSLAAHLRSAASAPAYAMETALGQLTIAACQDGRMLEYETAKLVLVVDQLEELFTAERISHGERLRFVELLSGLLRSDLVWVIATMRRDFWNRAEETPELVRRSNGDSRLELLPPTPAQLSQMIRRPAEAAGVTFEIYDTTNVPLNETIAEEVAREPGALPLLSYLLDQLYRIDITAAHGSTLTYATYERLGKLEGAIATQAEAVLDQCVPEDRAALGSVLFSLVDIGTAAADVDRAIARRVPLASFEPGTPQRRLVEALLNPNARLLVSDTEKRGTPTVRVAHEALISRWAQARDFVQSNAEALKIRRRIEERYALWLGQTGKSKVASWRARLGREPGVLNDIDLADGQRLLKEHRADTEPHLIAYIERSIADNDRTRSRTVRMLSAVASVVTILAIVASGAGIEASKRQHEAEYQAAETLKAQGRSLTQAAAERLKDSDVAGAQAIILEVLTNPQFAHGYSPASLNVFQETLAADTRSSALTGHSDRVVGAAFSADGRLIVTASGDKTARIWDAASGRQLRLLSGHTGRVESALFSADGRYVVTASYDSTARIWDAGSGKELLVLRGHTDRVHYAAFSPDGGRVVTASADKTARIWDVASGRQLRVLTGHTARIQSAMFSPDGQHVLTGSYDQSARIWDASSGKQLVLLRGHTDRVYHAAYSPDGNRVVTTSYDKTARIWDSGGGQQLFILSGHTDFVLRAGFSPDGLRVVTASDDKTSRVWDTLTGQQVMILKGHTNFVYGAAFAPDGRTIITAGGDKTARIWDTVNGQQLQILGGGHTGMVDSAMFSPDGRTIITASNDNSARIWDAESGKALVVMNGHTASVNSAAFSPDGEHVVTASNDRTARTWDAVNGKPLVVLDGHSNPVDSAAYSADGLHIVTSSLDKTARVWDALTGKQLITLSGHTDAVLSAAYSPDNSRIVTASMDKTARVWDAISGRQLLLLRGHTDIVDSAVYSTDGRSIVTASYDNTARIWDAANGRQQMVLTGHTDPLYSAAFSPDGQRIATGSADRTARIWDARSGLPLLVLSGHQDIVSSVAFSPDGRRIVTASQDGTARVWSARSVNLRTQIAWARAAQFDPLSITQKFQLGLSKESDVRQWPPESTKCDESAAAPYDPDRRGAGAMLDGVVTDIALPACTVREGNPQDRARSIYQHGRAQMAAADFVGARRDFEEAAAAGYRSANVDLATLLSQFSAGMPDIPRAVSLYEEGWSRGVTYAAFKLGNLYEYGLIADGGSGYVLAPDKSRARLWYKKAADAGDPNALARFAEWSDEAAYLATSTTRKDAYSLDSFKYYAAAANRARVEDWPDDAWRNWRYRRATLARLLAREGMMQQVAAASDAVLESSTPPRRRYGRPS